MGRQHLLCAFSASSPKQQTHWHVTTSLGKIRNLVLDPSCVIRVTMAPGPRRLSRELTPRPAQARPGTTMTVVPQNPKPAAEEKTAHTLEAKAEHRHGAAAAARRFDKRCRLASRCPRAASRCQAETQVAVPTRESSCHFAAVSAARPPSCRRIERNTCQCKGWTCGATGRTDSSTGGVVRRSCPPDAGRCPVPCASLRTRSTGRGAVMCKPR
jgi:hypothetical protein